MPDDLEAALATEAAAEAFLVYQFEQYRLLDSALAGLFASDRRLRCLSVGGSNSAALLFGAMRGRFSAIADLSKDVESSLWLRERALRPALPDDVEVRSADVDLFDDAALELLRTPDGGEQRFDVCFVHKTLHHLRENRCRFAETLPEHPGHDHECKGVLRPERVLERLHLFAGCVVVSEYYEVDEDPDKDGARGGMLDLEELGAVLMAATRLGTLEVFRPTRLSLRAASPREAHLEYGRRLADRLRFVDYVLFASVAGTRARPRARRAAIRARR